MSISTLTSKTSRTNKLGHEKGSAFSGKCGRVPTNRCYKRGQHIPEGVYATLRVTLSPKGQSRAPWKLLRKIWHPCPGCGESRQGSDVAAVKCEWAGTPTPVPHAHQEEAQSPSSLGSLFLMCCYPKMLRLNITGPWSLRALSFLYWCYYYGPPSTQWFSSIFLSLIMARKNIFTSYFSTF